MNLNGMVISVIIPALNEEENITTAIDNALSDFKELGLAGEVIVVNDGSTDSTLSLIKHKHEENPDIVKIVNHDVCKGVGASFWDGVDMANGDIVFMSPADNENDIKEVLRYIRLFKDVDVVIPFCFNKEIRTLLRNIISLIYIIIVNSTFRVNLHYTNGTIIYRTKLLRELGHRRKGFFFQTDIIVRLIRRRYLFAEVPYELKKRQEGISKALTWFSLYEVVRGYLNLFKDIYLIKTEENKKICAESVTFKRRKISK
jgi:glycosyltransferase involved in cell wall biosynthesis